MNLTGANFKTIIISALVILGLVVTVYLVKNPKIFKSKAGAEALNITTSDGQTVPQVVPGKFTTTSDHIKIGVQDINGL